MYIVDRDLTVGSSIIFTGDTELILCDGVTLTVDGSDIGGYGISCGGSSMTVSGSTITATGGEGTPDGYGICIVSGCQFSLAPGLTLKDKAAADDAWTAATLDASSSWAKTKRYAIIE